MDREMQQRLTEPRTHLPHHIVLTQFPVDNQFVNPGIGVNLYDFLVPLHGQEHFGISKSISETAGTIPEEKPKVPLKTEDPVALSVVQEGFGEPSSSKTSDPNDRKIEKLGSVFQAMQNAKVKTEKLSFVPKKQKGLGKKMVLKDKFKLV